jgi:SAM-dependent methyltransferase/transcriptional regulator with XRE-family HTH domain
MALGTEERVLLTDAALQALLQRLDDCAERLGSKRALAEAAGVSESQLYRYLSGDVVLPVDRLLAIAGAAKVDPAWLLTGSGSQTGFGPRPPFRPELLCHLHDALHKLLAESEQEVPAVLRGRMLTYIYETQRLEEQRSGVEELPEKFQLLKYVSFLAEMRTEEELDVLLEAFKLMEYGPRGDLKAHFQLLTLWCNLLVRGMRAYYNSYAGQVYFERMGQQLEADAVQELHQTVTEVGRLTSKKQLDWLDLGCGNGRHLAHLYKHMPNVRGRGLELSDLAVKHCQTLMRSEKLPVGAVEQGDMRNMPYAAGSFDVVFARLVLQSLPLLPGTGLGVEAVFEEIARVLRPTGVVYVLVPFGNGTSYRDFYRQHFNLDFATQPMVARHFDIRFNFINNLDKTTAVIKKLGQHNNSADLKLILQRK